MMKGKRTGYSKTPLAKKLGIKSDSHFKIVNQPDNYFSLFGHSSSGIAHSADRRSKKDVIHYFALSASQLSKDLPGLKKEMDQNGAIWISWPKQTSGVASDLNENVVRDLALQTGLVDVKVCAVDEIWSGLKLVIRLKDRGVGKPQR